ncbi:hypothetical protein E2C01_074977 [Portunus trituberculatus]|uniref:Secreted protein n=1 Tax=Portunus trituberculatus TaxID=210409 RepID=A0A5B7IEZ0_PORTR|nr:hypothetical protein [Portunus trituberculatus]
MRRASPWGSAMCVWGGCTACPLCVCCVTPPPPPSLPPLMSTLRTKIVSLRRPIHVAWS